MRSGRKLLPRSVARSAQGLHRDARYQSHFATAEGDAERLGMAREAKLHEVQGVTAQNRGDGARCGISGRIVMPILTLLAAGGLSACTADAAPDSQAPVRAPESAALEAAVQYHQAGQMEEEAAVLHTALDGMGDSADLHARLGYVYRYAGLMDESIEHYQRSQRLDPTPERIISTDGQIAKSLIYLGRYDEAIEAHENIYRILEAEGVEPDEKHLFYDGVAHLYAGRTSEALALLNMSAAATNSLWSDFARAYAHAGSGDQAALLALASEIEQRDDIADGERRYRLVHLFALAGEPDRALPHLEAAIRAGFFSAPYIAEDPFLEQVQDRDEFARLLSGARDRHQNFPHQ